MTVLLISGSMGSGKTTVMGEASDLLREMSISHAAIDLDAVSAHLFPDSASYAGSPRHETMAARLRVREPGMQQAEFVERSRTLEQRLTDAALEHFRVSAIAAISPSSHERSSSEQGGRSGQLRQPC